MFIILYNSLYSLQYLYNVYNDIIYGIYGRHGSLQNSKGKNEPTRSKFGTRYPEFQARPTVPDQFYYPPIDPIDPIGL